MPPSSFTNAETLSDSWGSGHSDTVSLMKLLRHQYDQSNSASFGLNGLPSRRFRWAQNITSAPNKLGNFPKPWWWQCRCSRAYLAQLHPRRGRLLHHSGIGLFCNPSIFSEPQSLEYRTLARSWIRLCWVGNVSLGIYAPAV